MLLDNSNPDNINADNINPDSNTDTYVSNPLLDFQLNQADRFAELLFVLGITFGFQTLDKADDAYFRKQEGQLTSAEDSAVSYDIANMLAFTNWLYLIAGSIIFETSSSRLNELEKALPENPSLSETERISGRKMVTAGNLFKMIGYSLSANGFEMIAKSVKDEPDSSESQQN